MSGYNYDFNTLSPGCALYVTFPATAEGDIARYNHIISLLSKETINTDHVIPHLRDALIVVLEVRKENTHLKAGFRELVKSAISFSNSNTCEDGEYIAYRRMGIFQDLKRRLFHHRKMERKVSNDVASEIAEEISEIHDQEIKDEEALEGYPGVTRCGICRFKGHDRSSCPAYLK